MARFDPHQCEASDICELTPDQREALDAYERFMEQYPEYFASRERRPIIRRRADLEAYTTKYGAVGVVAATPHVYFVVDLVESRTTNGKGIRHPYARVVSRGQLEGATSTVVLATIADPTLGCMGDIVLLEQERHATGSVESELPRGFGEPGLTGEQNALRELREETGFIGEEAYQLGSTYTNSGLMDERVYFYHVPATARRSSSPESTEAIVGVRFASREEVWEEIMAGNIRDGFTLQAMALFEKHQMPSE
jgi:ADP-ribose diphosphatase